MDAVGTTTLRIIGGFETPDKGQVLFDGKGYYQSSARQRQLNTVFRIMLSSLHMNIAENIAFGLKIKGKSKSYINDKDQVCAEAGESGRL